jgi:hypothetical protein
MALFGVPNPTKKITIDFPIEQVKKALGRIPVVSDEKYSITNINVAFNQYTLETLEFLSAGVFIDFNLLSLSDTRTEISIEVRRKIGSFDQSYEITNANNHINDLVNFLSNAVTLTDDDFNSKYEYKIDKINKKREENSKPWYTKNSSLIGVGLISLLFWPLLPVTIYGIYKRTQN